MNRLARGDPSQFSRGSLPRSPTTFHSTATLKEACSQATALFRLRIACVDLRRFLGFWAAGARDHVEVASPVGPVLVSLRFRSFLGRSAWIRGREQTQTRLKRELFANLTALKFRVRSTLILGKQGDCSLDRFDDAKSIKTVQILGTVSPPPPPSPFQLCQEVPYVPYRP